MITKNNLLYVIGAIIYIACFGYIVHDMLQEPAGRVLIFIYTTSVILTALIIVIGYKISKALLHILEKYMGEWYRMIELTITILIAAAMLTIISNISFITNVGLILLTVLCIITNDDRNKKR